MKKILLISLCSMALFSTATWGLTFAEAPIVEVKTYDLVKFLPSYNEALTKALEVHNLMTELPGLRAMAEQQDRLKKEASKMTKFFDNLLKCNEQRFGRFKNAKEVLSKVRTAYKDRTKELDAVAAAEQKDSIFPRSLSEKSALYLQKKDIEHELMSDVLKNPRKWGAQLTNKRYMDVPEDMREKMVGTGLEELVMAEDGTQNLQHTQEDYENVLIEMQNEFVQRLSSVGLSFPDFKVTKTGDIRKVQKALKELKQQYLEEAKEYIAKLDAQDAAHPRAVARRTALTQNKKAVTAKIREQYPDAFANAEQLDQQTPQQRQRNLISALEKDMNGSVYLTETNALEIDERMAENKADTELVEHVTEQYEHMFQDLQTQYPDASEFDFSVCS